MICVFVHEYETKQHMLSSYVFEGHIEEQNDVVTYILKLWLSKAPQSKVGVALTR